jgi:Ca-activated chloride channel family protein
MGRSLLVVSLWLLTAGLGDSAASKNNKGNRLYHEKKYGEALKHYRDAQLDNPKSPQIHFNTGDALFQAQEFDQATEEYSKTLSLGTPDRSLEAQTHDIVKYARACK